MIQLTIDHISLSVPEGTSVLEAARSAGIDIPSMCYLKGQSNHPSCLVCIVKDMNLGHLFPSCAMPVRADMVISTRDEEVHDARKKSLELLMSDHVGDCEAPCSLACPANMDIPVMNRLLGEGKFEEALHKVRETIALPYVLGYICPAPCEKACRRKQIDEPVSVCLLKRASAALGHESGIPFAKEQFAEKIAIIGTGPAGLSAAFYLLREGISCTLFDEQQEAGGALRYQIKEDQLPRKILDQEIGVIRSMGAEFRMETRVSEEFFRQHIQPVFDATILATGDMKEQDFYSGMIKTGKTGVVIAEDSMETSLPHVFACGSILRPQKMAVRAGAQGRDAAFAVIAKLRNERVPSDRKKFNSRFEKLFPEEFSVYLKEATKDARQVPAQSVPGFNAEEAMREARRCLHCDCRKLEECKLRDYCDEYGADRKKYLTGERNKMQKFDEHELVIYEPEKCIRCGLCIDIAATEGEKTGLAFFGRGFDVRMNVPFHDSFSVALTKTAEKCIEYCPTGALSRKK